MDQRTQEYLTFRRMITPEIIQIVFWVLVGIVAIVGLVGIIMGLVTMFRASFMLGVFTVFMNLIFVVTTPILIRIWCEIIILFFRMNETLKEISNNTAR